MSPAKKKKGMKGMRTRVYKKQEEKEGEFEKKCETFSNGRFPVAIIKFPAASIKISSGQLPAASFGMCTVLSVVFSLRKTENRSTMCELFTSVPAIPMFYHPCIK